MYDFLNWNQLHSQSLCASLLLASKKEEHNKSDKWKTSKPPELGLYPITQSRNLVFIGWTEEP